MEHEIRFYFSSHHKTDLLNRLLATGLTSSERQLEKTIQFDHKDPQYSFYTEEIDGRFRLRITKGKKSKICKVSWKRRLPEQKSASISVAEEKEFHVQPSEYKELLFILTNVLHLKPVESYERYRTTFSNSEVEIALDEYPFGLALEIENRSTTKLPQHVVQKWTKKLELNPKNSYPLSWDDKYTSLCHEQNVPIFKHVTFRKPMPKVNDKTW